MRTLDGSQGEGGGQILRTSLALSAVTGEPFTLEKIRAGRAKPGLARQHLACVLAAAEIVDAEVSGADLSSKRLRFAPRRVPAPGRYLFDIGTAGSTGLVFQTVLWPLLVADGPSAVVIRGGTHNPMAPPFDFLARSFLPALRRFGVHVELELVRHGFYPRGGGEIRATIAGGKSLEPVGLTERGAQLSTRVSVLCLGLPGHVARREADELAVTLGIDRSSIVIEEGRGSGTGNAVHVDLAFENVTEVVTAFGERGAPAERVARSAATEAHTYLAGEAPAGEHLADQLVIPLALAGAGTIRCTTPSLHTRTNVSVVSQLLGKTILLESDGDASYTMRLE